MLSKTVDKWLNDENGERSKIGQTIQHRQLNSLWLNGHVNVKANSKSNKIRFIPFCCHRKKLLFCEASRLNVIKSIKRRASRYKDVIVSISFSDTTVNIYLQRNNKAHLQSAAHLRFIVVADGGNLRLRNDNLISLLISSACWFHL